MHKVTAFLAGFAVGAAAVLAAAWVVANWGLPPILNSSFPTFFISDVLHLSFPDVCLIFKRDCIKSVPLED